MVRSRRLKRLQREAASSLLAAKETWTAQAMRRLSTEDLEHIERATAPDREEDILLSPAEKAAFKRFNEFYEEAKRGF